MDGTFGSYRATAGQWITVLETGYYPDYLEEASFLYSEPLQRFAELVEGSTDAAKLLVNISNEPSAGRTQLLRIFRRYVSPDTSVEMLKRRGKIPDIIADFGGRFRPLDEVIRLLAGRPNPDEALAAILWEYKDRGKKGYELTEFFLIGFGRTLKRFTTFRAQVEREVT